jgi:predicted nucleic acid-binding protein
MSFWDTSALLRLYTAEPDTPAFDALRQSLMPIHAARLAAYELRAALRRREAEGVVAAGAAQTAFEKFSADIIAGNVTIHEESPDVQAEFGDVLEDCYSASPTVLVRTADAIHIATAFAAGETDFVTADARQKQAAEVCGLTVFP